MSNDLELSGTRDTLQQLVQESNGRAAFLSGSAVPDDEDDGRDGDLYFRTGTRMFYLKAAGAWSAVGSLTAP